MGWQVNRHLLRRFGAMSLAVVTLLLFTGGSCVRLVRSAENSDPGTYTDMEPLCDKLRQQEPYRGLIGSAKPRPGGNPGTCEWLPTDTPGRIALKVETVLHHGPVIENTTEHVTSLIHANQCADSCPEMGEYSFLDISVRWLGCGQATNPESVRYFGVFWHENIVISVTMQTRWRVPAQRLPSLVTDPAGPLRVLFQTAYLTFTYNETLPTPAPLRSPGKQSGCDR